METFYDLNHIEALLNQVRNNLPDLDTTLHPLRSLVISPITSIVTAPFNYFYQEHLLDEKLKNLDTQRIDNTREWLGNLADYTVDNVQKIHDRLNSNFDYSKEIFDYARSLKDVTLTIRDEILSNMHLSSQHISYIEIFGILSLLGISTALIILFLQNRELRKQVTEIKQSINKN